MTGTPAACSLAFQGDYYRGVAAACLAVPACSGITTWGLSDRYTWLLPFFGVTDWPLPFDDAWERKTAYFGMRTGSPQRWAATAAGGAARPVTRKREEGSETLVDVELQCETKPGTRSLGGKRERR